MPTRSAAGSGLRSLAANAFLTGILLVAAATRAEAQAAQPDARWQAYLGCWSDVAGVAAALTCIAPVAGTPSAVEIATVADGKVVARERVDASGERRANDRDGCTGWESARWSPDGRRVYLRSEHACAGGLRRATSGILAMSPAYEWLAVQGITAGGNSAVRVVRYRDAGVPSSVPGEIASALQAVEGRTLGAEAARTAAAAPLGTRDVIEASRAVDAAVVQAWLTERGQNFAVDAKQLIELADAGVPARVIDLMVALSYPRAFTVRPSTGEAQPRPAEGVRTATTYGSAVGGPSVVLDTRGYWPYDYYYSSLYGYGLYGRGYNNWYWGDQPVVIVRVPSGGQASSHGRVVKGSGYSRGGRDASSPGSEATPRSSRGSSGSGASESSGRSSGSDNGGSGRQAKPRP